LFIMAIMRYVLLQQESKLTFVEMPASHAYQLSALNLRLHKEVDKLTADEVPNLPLAVAECDNVELHSQTVALISGLDYINQLESEFAAVKEQSYPLISLLTE